MGLGEYRRKRHFHRTPAPAGETASPGGRSFVIQKHAASRLHYDIRLELDGVLKSWAVPKGPSLDPAVKRLAMEVEDHPVEYGDFEGVIPKGEYGGGTVMLWDRGNWEPIDDDPNESYRQGKLKFILHGEKLHGAWMLVRTRGMPGAKSDRAWLLFKERDEEARPAREVDILEESPLSVATRRDMDEIAADRDCVWSSTQPAATKPPPGRARRRPSSKAQLADAADYDARTRTFAGVRLTSPEKILYPEQGITKLELASYYRDLAEWILPHIAKRPLVLMRCPEGREAKCFYQKHPPAGTPEALHRVAIREKRETADYVMVDDVAGLISLAQISALEIHVWGSRTDLLERPDRLVFDLDPDPSVPWSRVVASARQIREFLEELGLVSFVKTTGGKGLHLVVPIERRHEWNEALAFCKLVADSIVKADPRSYTANMSKAARPGKIFVDYLRNDRGATAVAPYSTRSLANAPVSVPLSWSELSSRTRSDRYTLRNLSKRLTALRRDPWEDVANTRQTLTTPLARLRELWS